LHIIHYSFFRSEILGYNSIGGGRLKVGGAEDCYLRGLTSSRGSGGMPPRKIFENSARRLNLGAFEAKK